MAKSQLEACMEIIDSMRKRIEDLETENTQLKQKPVRQTASAKSNFVEETVSIPPKGMMQAVMCGNTDAIASYSNVDVSEDSAWKNFSRQLMIDRANKCLDPHIKRSLLRQAEIEYYAGTEEYITC